MINYSELIIVFLMLPVAIQIIVPLLMFTGFFLVRTVEIMFREKRVVAA